MLLQQECCYQYVLCCGLNLIGSSLFGERIYQQGIAQLTGGPRYLRSNVLIREDAKGAPFVDVNAKAALSSQLF